MEMIEIGVFDGEIVRYAPKEDVLSCKEVYTFFSTIEKFKRDNQVRTWLTSDTLLVKREKTYKLGCLEDTHKVFDDIYDNIKSIKYSK